MWGTKACRVLLGYWDAGIFDGRDVCLERVIVSRVR